MGIYGLQTWGDYYARWLKAEQSEEQIRQARVRGRMALTQALLQEQGQPDTLGEDLACPSCKSQYEFGDVCPACDVELVCVSFVDAVEPFHRKVEHPAAVVCRSAAFAGAAFSVCVILTGIFLAIDPHPTIAIFGRDAIHMAGGPEPDDGTTRSVVHKAIIPERIAFVDTGKPLTHRLWVEVESEPAGERPSLHLLGPQGRLEGDLDCHSVNCTASTKPLDWGIPGFFIDDPVLWGDAPTDTRQGVRILSPTPGVYSVMLVLDEQGLVASSPTRVRVYVDGKLAFDEERASWADSGSVMACQVHFPEGDVWAI